jgi:hypothetical protein
MIYAVIENDLVINVVISDSKLDESWVLSDSAKIGDSYINNVFISPPPPPVIIPTLTMRQARLSLLDDGLLDEVEAAITTPENRIWWDYSTTVERSHPLVDAVLTALGKTETEIDDMFIAAATL